MKNVYKLVLNSIIAITFSFTAIFLLYKYMFPFVCAIVLSIIIDPIVSFLEKKMGVKRWMAVLLSILFSFSFIFILVFFLSQQIINEIVAITKTNQFETLFSSIGESIEGVIEKLFIFNSSDQIINIESEFNNLSQYFLRELLNTKNYILDFFALIPRFFISFIITLITTYFISTDKKIIIEFISKVTPRKLRKNTLLTINRIVNSIFIIIKTELTLVVIFTAITIFGFSLLGVRYSILLGVVCGILDLLPVIGPSTIFIPWILYGLLVQNNIVFSLALLCLYIILVVLRQVIQAKMMSSNLGLHPVMFLIAVYIGMKFFGIIGIIIAPFIFIIAREIIKANIESISKS